MRKIIYTCDRCGAEIDGAAGQVCIFESKPDGEQSVADDAELTALFDSPTEKAAIAEALDDPGWDLCAECVASVLRTLIRKDAPRAIVKGPLPDAPKRRGGRKKKEESNENNSTV